MARARHLSPYTRRRETACDVTCEGCSAWNNDEPRRPDVGMWRAIGAASAAGVVMYLVAFYLAWHYLPELMARLVG